MLPNGDLIASHDLFGPKSSKDTTRVFGSKDKGQSWSQLAELKGQFWSTLFVHEGVLYVMGTSRVGGDCIIRRSNDGGRTWTTPRNEDNGLLLTGAAYHCAPVPVLVHQGRLWRAMEDGEGPGGWGSRFRSFMMSAPVEADLLDASSWTSSNRLERDPSWLDNKFGGWLEGNAVATPGGKVLNILRADYRPDGGKAAVIEIDETGTRASFDPETGFIDFPGGCKKFTIRHDPKTDKYWSLTNYIRRRHRGGNPERTRNTLALTVSEDLRAWTVRSIILYRPDTKKTGFQYADWLFDGDDMVVVSRTAHDDGAGGAHNCHDANYLTFHRVANFRERTQASRPLE